MLSREARILLAGLQAIIGWEWLVSGANKVASGTFPQGLADALGEGLKDNPNGWYVRLLNAVVLPHSVLFGTLIQWTEVAVGLGLLAGALVLLGRLPRAGEAQFALAKGLLVFGVIAGLTCAFLCANFHFWMGEGMLPGLDPSHPFDEGIDLDTLMPPLALLVALANARLLWLLRSGPAAVEHRPRVDPGQSVRQAEPSLGSGR